MVEYMPVSRRTQKSDLKLTQKRAALVRAFLLWNYQNLPVRKKRAIEKKRFPEILRRTMALEGDYVSKRAAERAIAKYF
jgi:hypothetical protein